MATVKSSINVVVLGNKGVGKSTMVASLVAQKGNIPKSLVTRFRGEQAEERAFPYLWMQRKLDLESKFTTGSIDNTISRFETDRHDCMLLDTTSLPGESIPIAQICQSDLGFLILDATDKQIVTKNNIRELIWVAHGLGLKKLIVCINKMDKANPPYSFQVYQDIEEEMITSLLHVGYKNLDFQFVPCSALKNENLTTWNTALAFSRRSLTQAVDAATEGVTFPQFDPSLPLRLPIFCIHKIQGIGTVVVGRIQSGVLNQGMEVSDGFGLTTEVKVVETVGFPIAQAFAGDNVRVCLGDVPLKHLLTGRILSNSSTVHPATDTAQFNALISLRNLKKPIKAPYSCILQCHLHRTTATIAKVHSTIDDDGNEVDIEPTKLSNGHRAIVDIKPFISHFAVEPFTEFPALGRFVLKDAKDIIAIGIVRAVEKIQQSYVANDGHSADPTLGEVNTKIDDRERRGKFPPRRGRGPHATIDRDGSTVVDRRESRGVHGATDGDGSTRDSSRLIQRPGDVSENASVSHEEENDSSE